MEDQIAVLSESEPCPDSTETETVNEIESQELIRIVEVEAESCEKVVIWKHPALIGVSISLLLTLGALITLVCQYKWLKDL